LGQPAEQDRAIDATGNVEAVERREIDFGEISAQIGMIEGRGVAGRDG
jgi:hypothetical protein